MWSRTGDAGLGGGAGTDADVYLTITGRRGVMPERRLYRKGNPFESGERDYFDISGPNVGNLTQIRIRHNNTGIASAWNLDWVQVEYLGSDRAWRFNAGRWLSDDPRIVSDCAIDITIPYGSTAFPTLGVAHTCMKLPETQSTTVPAPTFPTASSLLFWNCGTKDLRVWRRDWTASRDEYIDSVAPGPPYLGAACGPGESDPDLAIELPDNGHQYEIFVLDPSDLPVGDPASQTYIAEPTAPVLTINAAADAPAGT
jgi:hypothetical protein